MRLRCVPVAPQLRQYACEGQPLRREPSRERAPAHAKLGGNLAGLRLAVREQQGDRMFQIAAQRVARGGTIGKRFVAVFYQQRIEVRIAGHDRDGFDILGKYDFVDVAPEVDLATEERIQFRRRRAVARRPHALRRDRARHGDRAP